MQLLFTLAEVSIELNPEIHILEFLSVAFYTWLRGPCSFRNLPSPSSHLQAYGYFIIIIIIIFIRAEAFFFLTIMMMMMMLMMMMMMVYTDDVMIITLTNDDDDCHQHIFVYPPTIIIIHIIISFMLCWLGRQCVFLKERRSSNVISKIKDK